MPKKTHNLIESWLAVEQSMLGKSIAQAVRDMNEDLQSSHSPQRVNEWRRGDRSMPEPVQAYMLRLAILHALREAVGVDLAGVVGAKRINELVDMLSPPKRV